MMKTRVLIGMLFVGTVLGLSACGPIVPVSPTWKDDVRPLVMARCVRCHDYPLRVDPTIVPAVTPDYSFNYPPDVDLMPPLPARAPVELLFLWGAAGKYVRGFENLAPMPPQRRMPPPPAAPLEDWQIEIFDAWAAAPSPR